MITDSNQQEILLMTNSSFAEKQWATKDNELNKLTPEEKMEEACANGLIQELLPEIFNSATNKIYLWEMHNGLSFLQLQLGEFPLALQNEFSLNPHDFLAIMCLN